MGCTCAKVTKVVGHGLLKSMGDFWLTRYCSDSNRFLLLFAFEASRWNGAGLAFRRHDLSLKMYQGCQSGMWKPAGLKSKRACASRRWRIPKNVHEYTSWLYIYITNIPIESTCRACVCVHLEAYHRRSECSLQTARQRLRVTGSAARCEKMQIVITWSCHGIWWYCKAGSFWSVCRFGPLQNMRQSKGLSQKGLHHPPPKRQTHWTEHVQKSSMAANPETWNWVRCTFGHLHFPIVIIV